MLSYSFNNTMLIAMQKPDATLVAGFKAWQKNFDRHVKKGEKGIRILAPAPYKIKEEQEKLDPVTGEIMLDKNGMPITEEVEIKIPAFRVVPVFDVSQTDGKELPDIGVNELSGSVEDYEDFMQALTEVSPVPITYEDIEGEVKGYFHTTDHRIAIQEGMSQSQTVKTAIHEVAHAKLHDRERNQDIDAVLDKDRNTQEVEAESVAYTVCQHFGIDTSDYSFGYIAGWSSDRDMKELKSSLDTIRKTASELITGIEDRLAELQKDRAVEQEQNKESILLIQNDDLTKYSLVSVVGMDRQELMDVLSAMSEDDKLSIQAYLESKGAWTTEIANENTKEFGEYHLDVRYNTDTEELVDMKERKAIYDKSMEPIAAGDVVVKFSGSMGSEWEISKITNMSPDEVKKLLYDMALLNESEWDGDYNAYLKEHGAEMTLISSSAGLNEHAPQFFDFAYDADTGVSASTELSAIQQAENLINRMEHGATVFTDDERNLIVNYNYKLDDMEKTRELAEKLAYMIENQPVNEALQKHMDIENDKVSYYVIADLSTWAENSPERSKLERFDSISEAMEAFQTYRGKDAQYSDDKARTTFGVSVHGIEFDVIHVRNNENVLSLDFTHSSEAKESKHFMDDLQTLSDSIGIEKVRVHRDMSPEEVKDFVKQRFEHQLKQGGLDDISLYMSRFNTLYEQGKMEKLMPTANQKHIEENVPITEWDNLYFEVKEPEQMAFAIKDKLAEYKPLAKVEELTEQNYNMIDNVLNNGAEKKEQEQTKGRISIKEKLAEKKAVIEQRDKAERTSPEKETEKKSQREM